MFNQTGSKWKNASAALVISGLALSTAVTGAFAQDEATPAAGIVEVPADITATRGTGSTAAEKTALTSQIQQLSDFIALVQTDRDAIAATVDVTDVDALITKSTSFRDAARATLLTDDISTAPKSVAVGMQTIVVAQALLQANATVYGLPSQQAGASHVLVQAYYAIDEAGGIAADPAADPDTAFFVDAAEKLYAGAYEQYNAGTYAQAQMTAGVAEQLAGIATSLQFSAMFSVGLMGPEGGYGGVSTTDVYPSDNVTSVEGMAPGAIAEPGNSEGSIEAIPAENAVDPGFSTVTITGGSEYGVVESEMAGHGGVVSIQVDPHGEMKGGMRSAIAGPGVMSGEVVAIPGYGFGNVEAGGFGVRETTLEVPAPNFD